LIGLLKRDEIWWANLPPPVGRRPVLLLSRDRAYQVRTAVTVAEITRTIRQIAVEVVLDQSDGMPTRCAVNLDTILTIPKTLIETQITTLSTSKIQLVEKAIKFALNLP
jgi:mRNA interferase MazF